MESASMSYTFFVNFGGHKSFLWDHWFPCFELLMMSALGFKTRVGSHIHTWQRCTVHISRDWFTCGVTPAASWWLAWQPSHSFPLIPVSMYWWGSNPGLIMPQMNTLPTELCQLSFSMSCIFTFFVWGFVIKIVKWLTSYFMINKP